MTSLVIGVTATLALSMAFSLYRVVAGPTIFDRLTGLNLTGTSAIILLLLLGLLDNRVEAFVDITIAYALISFVGTLTLAKYFERTDRPE